MEYKVKTVSTSPYTDQNPGTSGLRKKCEIFLQPNYIENFLQSIFININQEKRKKGTLIIGGDGRYYCRESVLICTRIAAANHFKGVMVLQNGWGSTPAISHMIRKYNAIGAIVLTASHNPGGINEDFGGAPESETQLIFKTSKNIKTFSICDSLHFDIDTLGSKTVKIIHGEHDCADFTVEVVDSTHDYVNYMKEIFDFPALKEFLTMGFDGQTPISLCIDARNGIAGPYVQSIFCDCLGCSESSLDNFKPLQDFGSLHPDPNLTYASDFVEKMVDKDFGAAYDGDADRCMIIGRNKYFVSPSDSIAIVAANAVAAIPYFTKKGKLTGVARSMPTGSALDQVAKLSIFDGGTIKCYEVPTGWKFFCNLMDAGLVDICGEESFGAGSSHLREKDGIWLSLAWLSIMALQRKPINEIIFNHWKKFGRNYYTRYDYENLTCEEGEKVLKSVEDFINGKIIGTELLENNIIEHADNFSYTDPTDNSKASKQGYRIITQTGDRIIVRLSGTGSFGATIRIYIEHYENDVNKINIDAAEILKPLIKAALKITKIVEITKRSGPTVIT